MSYELAREPMALRGQIDTLTPNRLRGWAYDPLLPDEPVVLVVTNNGEVLTRIVADIFRNDLVTAQIGDGRHAFDCWLPSRLSPNQRNVVRVFRERDGCDLLLSPIVLECGEAFGPLGRARLEDLLRSPLEAPALRDHIAFFESLLDGLKQRAADEMAEAETRLRRKEKKDAPAPRLRALVIDNGLPDTTRDAGSLAILSHARCLARLGYDVSFVPSDLHGGGSVHAEALEAEGFTLYVSPQVASVEEVLRRQSDSFDCVYIHRITNAARYTALVQATQPLAFLIYSVADLHHVRMIQQGRLEDDPNALREGVTMRLREFYAAWQASAVVTHSSAEAEQLRAVLPAAAIYVVPWDVRPNAVVRSFADRRHIAFVGGFRHAPNVAAATRLVKKIMPRVWRSHPDIRCILVGSDMPDSLLELGSSAVEPVGHVRDLFLALNRIRLTVAPLTFGAGVKGKVLESLAHGIPCVMSEIAAEGVSLPDELRECVAGDDESFARLIIALHEDGERNAIAANAGLRFIGSAFSQARVDDAMRQVLRRDISKEDAYRETSDPANPLRLTNLDHRQGCEYNGAMRE